MKREQTAVDSLIEKLLPFIDRSKISDTAFQNIVEEHLAMEKEQTVQAFDNGLITENVYYGHDDKKAEKYYESKYGKDENKAENND